MLNIKYFLTITLIIFLVISCANKTQKNSLSFAEAGKRDLASSEEKYPYARPFKVDRNSKKIFILFSKTAREGKFQSLDYDTRKKVSTLEEYPIYDDGGLFDFGCSKSNFSTNLKLTKLFSKYFKEPEQKKIFKKKMLNPSNRICLVYDSEVPEGGAGIYSIYVYEGGNKNKIYPYVVVLDYED